MSETITAEVHYTESWTRKGTIDIDVAELRRDIAAREWTRKTNTPPPSFLSPYEGEIKPKHVTAYVEGLEANGDHEYMDWLHDNGKIRPGDADGDEFEDTEVFQVKMLRQVETLVDDTRKHYKPLHLIDDQGRALCKVDPPVTRQNSEARTVRSDDKDICSLCVALQEVAEAQAARAKEPTLGVTEDGTAYLERGE